MLWCNIGAVVEDFVITAVEMWFFFKVVFVMERVALLLFFAVLNFHSNHSKRGRLVTEIPAYNTVPQTSYPQILESSNPQILKSQTHSMVV